MQNILTWSRYQEILQNLHFADNSEQDQTNKGYKIRHYKIRHKIIDQLNKSFQENYSNKPTPSTDKHLTKFKGRYSMRQYLKMKPIKWSFKWWFRSASSNGYLYEFD